MVLELEVPHMEATVLLDYAVKREATRSPVLTWPGRDG